MRISEHTRSRLIVVAFILVLTGAGNAFATGSTTTQEPQIQSVPPVVAEVFRLPLFRADRSLT